jgi:hypothetical protein
MKKLKKNIIIASALVIGATGAGTLVSGATINNNEIAQQQDVGAFADGSLAITIKATSYKEIDVTYDYKATTKSDGSQLVKTAYLILYEGTDNTGFRIDTNHITRDVNLDGSPNTNDHTFNHPLLTPLTTYYVTITESPNVAASVNDADTKEPSA